MNSSHKIIIAGAGGVGRALGLILAEISPEPPRLFIGNRTPAKAEAVAKWITEGVSRDVPVEAFRLPETGMNDRMIRVLKEADLLLDCLPGSEAPRMADLARQYGLHYANLTEHVAATKTITELAGAADTGFLLQTGLAPGYINVLAHGLFQQFCERYNVKQVRSIAMRVGALTRHASGPHYYAFTWSPAGVATEYLKQAICVRQGVRTALPPLSDRETLIINGRTLEADLTSGGAADLPDALAGRVEHLDYKTLRYPGHYDWVTGQLESILPGEDPVATLQRQLEIHIPHAEEDVVYLYAAVEGKDNHSVLRRIEDARVIEPQTVGRYRLRAIQTTTAAPIAQAAELLLAGNHKGVVLQSMLDPRTFLNGRFVQPFFGSYEP